MYLGQFALHVGEDVEKTGDGIPQAAVRQGHLILWTRALHSPTRDSRILLLDEGTHLNVFGQGVEHLFGHVDRSTEIFFAMSVDHLFARVMPVEVHDRFLRRRRRRRSFGVVLGEHRRYLEAEEVVDGADDDVHIGVAARLQAQVVLKFEIVSFAEQLAEAKERNGEIGIVQILLAGHAIGSDTCRGRSIDRSKKRKSEEVALPNTSALIQRSKVSKSKTLQLAIRVANDVKQPTSFVSFR